MHTIKSSGNPQACSLVSPPSPLPPFCGFSDEWKVLSQNTASAISLTNLGLKLKATAYPSVPASRDKTRSAGLEDMLFSMLWFSLRKFFKKNKSKNQNKKQHSPIFKKILNTLKIMHFHQQMDKEVLAILATLAL